MEVDFDDQIFALQRHGGISRYFVELLRQFDADPSCGVTTSLPFRWTVNDHLLEVADGRVRRPPLPGAWSRPRVVRQMNRLRATRRACPSDLVHHTYYLEKGLHTGHGKRVVTVYDMIPELLPDEFPHGSPHAAKAEYLAAADGIACISETTRRDLERMTDVGDTPVVVTPLAVGTSFYAARSSPSGEAYLLFVGVRPGYKNFDVVLRAMARSSRLPPLLCVGGGPLTQAERARVDELGLSGRVRQEAVRDAALPSVYAGACCFVFPSRYEGFGLPVLEAMAAGCPVVVAETDCFAEVAGDSAASFPADDDEALAAVLERLVTDRAWADLWRDRGRARAPMFSWRDTAERTASLYATVLGR